MAGEIAPASHPGSATGRYTPADIRADVLAGLTIAVMGVPQAMAYALIAGLPPVYGLYTAISTCIVAALAGSSRHLVTGPTNALSMVILSVTTAIAAPQGLAPIEIVLLLTLMVGLIQLALGLMRLGGIVRYVSNSVVVGFTAGAGVLIILNQLRHVLGITLPGGQTGRTYEVLYYTLQNLPSLNPLALALGGLTALLALYLPRLNRRLPGPLIGILAATGIGYLLGWYQPEWGEWKVRIVGDIQPIQAALDLFHVPQLVRAPDLALTGQLLFGALAIALLGLIEAASIARAVAASSGQRINFSREFAGQGLANLTGSIFSSFAASGSFTRTAICYKAGGRTRVAAIMSAVWTAVILLLFAPVANYIPQASLAGLLIVIAASLVDRERLVLTWRSGVNSRVVLFGTLAATLIMPLDYAIFVGIGLSIIILLGITGTIDLTQLVPLHGGGYEEIPFEQARPATVTIVNLEGDLYFAAVEDLDYEMQRCISPETQVLVLRMKRLRAVGSSAMAMLEHFYELLHARNVRLVVCGIEESLKDVMTGSGLRRRIGELNIFYADNRLLQSLDLAMARARSIVVAPSPSPALAGATDGSAVTAGDLMSRRCVRFGLHHQLRESLWLMSEFYRHTGTTRSVTLFLQDKQAKLAAGLTVHDIIDELSRGLDPQELAGVSDEALGEKFRARFGNIIDLVATAILVPTTKTTPVDDLVAAVLEHRLRVLPVCDARGGLLGVIDQTAILRAVRDELEQVPPAP